MAMVVPREEERVSREALLYFSLFFGTLVLFVLVLLLFDI